MQFSNASPVCSLLPEVGRLPRPGLNIHVRDHLPHGSGCAGDRQAAADVIPLVYAELRKLAAARMAAERPGHTLDATALVHEAYLRLVGDQQFDGNVHFFAAAAEAMRRVLVNHAADRARLKRGGRRNRVELDRISNPAAATDDDLLDIDDALNRLADEYPVAADLVKLRFFGGMTLGDASQALGIPPNRRQALGVCESLARTGALRTVVLNIYWNPLAHSRPERCAFGAQVVVPAEVNGGRFMTALTCP